MTCNSSQNGQYLSTLRGHSDFVTYSAEGKGGGVGVDVGVAKSKKSVLLVRTINKDQHNKILVVYQNGAYIGLFVVA